MPYHTLWIWAIATLQLYIIIIITLKCYQYCIRFAGFNDGCQHKHIAGIVLH